MLKRIASVLVLLFSFSCLAAQDLQIKGGDVKVVKVDKVVVIKEDVTVVTSLPFTIAAPPGAFDYLWKYPATVTAVEKDDQLEITAAPKGELTISCKVTSVDWDNKKFVRKTSIISFAVGEVKPPTPPDPPEPPTPMNILGVDGLAVFAVTELTADGLKGTSGQLEFLNSADVRKYLDSKCAVDPAKPNWKAYRFLKVTTDVSGDHKVWQDAMKRPRKMLPWIIISSPKGSYEGEMPQTYDECFALLKKYAEK